jgi:hypothetical protein
VQLVDATYSSPYYYNEALGITQWEHPGMGIAATAPPAVHIAASERKRLVEPQIKAASAHHGSSTGTQVRPLPFDYAPKDSGNSIHIGTSPEGFTETNHDDALIITRGNISLGIPDATSETTNQDATALASEPMLPKKKQKPPKLTHDYEHLANLYRFQRKYMEPIGPLRCVLCQERLCSDVLFPCQHRCVCPECIVLHQVCEHQHMGLVKDGHFNCPLCGEIIKRIIPSSGGSEVDQYWEWVLAVKPPLPDGFMKNFRHSAAVIEKVYIQDKTENEPSRLCTVS